MLNRKLGRDLRIDIKSFVSVFIICMLSVTLYLGIDVGWRGMEEALEVQFDECTLADLWVPAQLSDKMLRDIEAIPGVLAAQRRVNVRVEVNDLPGDPRLMLMDSEGEMRVNTPMRLSGETFPIGYRSTCLLNPMFAKAHGLVEGDTISVTCGDQRLELRVAGMAHSAEYVVLNDMYSFRAEEGLFGYAFVSPGTLGFVPYNQVCVKLAPGVDLAAIKQRIETMLDNPEISLITRNDFMGIKMASEEAEQIRAMGAVFPTVFFLVAALITFSTMKRMVDQQRQQIGTLCSLGYSHRQLTLHYMSYGLLVSAIGSLIGIVVGRWGVGEILVAMLASVYIMPGVAPVLSVPVMVVVCAATIVIAVGASYLSCRQALREVPSGLLRPKPPVSGKRALIEKVPVLWDHLGFSNKLILRNMSRNKMRLLIGLVGVTGCTALMLTGFGMRDSVAYVLSNHYGNTMRYQARATLVGSPDDDYIHALFARSGADRMERTMEGALELVRGDTFEIRNYFVLEDHHEAVYLKNRSGERIWLCATGAAITERMAEETGLVVGDTMRLRAANGKEGFAKVEQIVSVQLGQGIYMSRSAWRKMDLLPYSPMALMLFGDQINAAALEEMDGVDRVRSIMEERNGNESVLVVLNAVVVIMVLFAGILALVVLYTLGQLNFHERIRELATLMVLGFFPRESKRLILRENIITALIGIPIGLVAGPYLHRWVLAAGLPKTLEFIPYIAPTSWIYTSLLAIGFAQIVNWMVGAKFKHVDMVESLKSVE